MGGHRSRKVEFPFRLKKFASRVEEFGEIDEKKENTDIQQINDEKARAELARSVGLKIVPKKTWSSFDEVYGLLTDAMRFEKNHDSVEIVRRVRRGH